MGQGLGVGSLPANLGAMFLNFSTVFQTAFQDAPSFADRVAMTVPSSSRATLHGWMDKLPDVREWVGPRVIQNAKLQRRLIENKFYETTVGIPEEDIEDDQVGLYTPMVQMMGQSMKQFADKQIAKLINDNPIAYDGKPFFAADHPVDTYDPDKGAQSNIIDGDLSEDTYEQALALMAEFKGADGNVMGIQGTALMVPTRLQGTARRIMNGAFYPKLVQGGSLGNGDVGVQANIWQGSGDVIVNPWLLDPTAAYLLALGSAIRPFVHQVRRAVRFTNLVNPSDANVFWNRQFIMGADRRDAFDVTLPMLAVKIKNI